MKASLKTKVDVSRYTFPPRIDCEHRESQMWVISSCETNVPRTVIRGMHLTERHLIRPPDRVKRLHCITRRWHRGALAFNTRTRMFFPSRACMSRHYHARERTPHSPLCRVITAWAKTIRDAMSHNTGPVVTTRDSFRNGRLPSASITIPPSVSFVASSSVFLSLNAKKI